jgi:hypothetical protein
MEKEVKMTAKPFTRREFLKTSSSAAIAGALFMNSPDQLFADTGEKTRVVLIRNKDVLDDLNKPSKDILRRMLDEAVTTLVGEKDLKKAWAKLVKPEDIVGIKTNVWRFLPTPKELEELMRERIMEAGVPEKNIGLEDWYVLQKSNFKKATALFNVRPLRAHHWSGVGSLLKNYIMFVKQPDSYHGDSCADLATLWKLPIVKDKTRLNILVMLTPQFHNMGPHNFNPKYVWSYNGLLVGFDPVAVDATGVRILQAKRKEFFGEDRPLNPPAKHIFLADTRHHLGTADPGKIELIKLGWEEGAFI